PPENPMVSPARGDYKLKRLEGVSEPTGEREPSAEIPSAVCEGSLCFRMVASACVFLISLCLHLQVMTLVMRRWPATPASVGIRQERQVHVFAFLLDHEALQWQTDQRPGKHDGLGSANLGVFDLFEHVHRGRL